MGSALEFGRRRRERDSAVATGVATVGGSTGALAAAFLTAFLTFGGAVFLTGPLRASAFRVSLRASRTERRLVGPRTGARRTNTQPTFGTGFPPISRPPSNSQEYWPWNA